MSIFEKISMAVKKYVRNLLGVPDVIEELRSLQQNMRNEACIVRENNDSEDRFVEVKNLLADLSTQLNDLATHLDSSTTENINSLRNQILTIQQITTESQIQFSRTQETLNKIEKNQSKITLILLDWPNLLHSTGTRINRHALYSYLENKYKPSEINVHAFVSPKHPLSRFHTPFPVHETAGGQSLDLAMLKTGEKLVELLYYRLDKVVIITADGDFNLLIDSIQNGFGVSVYLLFPNPDEVSQKLTCMVTAVEKLDIEAVIERTPQVVDRNNGNFIKGDRSRK